MTVMRHPKADGLWRNTIVVGSHNVLLYKLIIWKHDLLKSLSLFWGHAFYKSTHENAGKEAFYANFII